MDRSTARAMAMKLIYEWEMGGDGGDETKINLLEIEPGDGDGFIDEMVEGVRENAEALDAQIAKYAIGWTIERITKVDLAILRMAAYELMQKKVPAAVAINEAVTLADVYSTDKAGAFVNGVLGSLYRGEYQ